MSEARAAGIRWPIGLGSWPNPCHISSSAVKASDGSRLTGWLLMGCSLGWAGDTTITNPPDIPVPLRGRYGILGGMDTAPRRDRNTPINRDALQVARLRKGWSIAGLADAAGVSRSHRYEIEQGTAGITPANLLKLAQALGVDVADLLTRPLRDTTQGGR